MKATSKENKNGKENIVQRFVRFFNGTSVCARIFAVVAIVFFFFGIFTVGGLNGTGKSATVKKSTTVTFAYDLQPEGDQDLHSVYVNVGAVYAPVGSSAATDSVQISATYVQESGGSTSAVGTIYVHDIYTRSKTESHKSNANYNWVLIGSGHYHGKTVLLTFNRSYATAEINEVAFLDEEGGLIKAKVNEAKSEGVSRSTVAATLDAPGSFHMPGSAYYDFSQSEEYMLNSIYAVRNGGQWLSNAKGDKTATSTAAAGTTDYNSFGILVYTLSTAIFGTSAFGLRLPSFLSAFGTFVLLYFLGKKAFKSDKWGLVLAVVFGIGGTFSTVGRLGTPMALALLAVVACIYCMYLFYANGISRENPVCGALSVLFSGLCFGVALAVHTVAALPCVIALVLFALGVVRLVKANRYALEKVTAKGVAAKADGEETAEEGVEETERAATPNAEERKIRLSSEYQMRLVIAFFAVAFVGFPLILLIVSGIPTYYLFATNYLDLSKYSAESNYLFLFLQKGLGQCFSIGDKTSLTAGNASSVGTWLLALSGATVYTQSQAVDGVTMISQVNVQPNFLMTAVAAVAVLFMTVYVLVTAFVKKPVGREAVRKQKNVLRIYVGLLVGCVTTFLPYLIVSLVGETNVVSAEQSYFFELFYLSFIVLALYALDGEKKTGTLSKTDIALCVLLGVFFVLFLCSMPMYFGWSVSEGVKDGMYNWTAVLSNGNYGLVKLNR